MEASKNNQPKIIPKEGGGIRGWFADRTEGLRNTIRNPINQRRDLFGRQQAAFLNVLRQRDMTMNGPIPHRVGDLARTQRFTDGGGAWQPWSDLPQATVQLHNRSRLPIGDGRRHPIDARIASVAQQTMNELDPCCRHRRRPPPRATIRVTAP